MTRRVEDTPIETWAPGRTEWWWTIPVVAFFSVWLTFIGGMLIEALRDGDLPAAGLAFAACVFGIAVAVQPFRYSSSRLEIRQDGLTVVSLGRRRRIPWSDVARVEVDDVDSLRSSGPYVVLVLTDRRRVRLLATQQSAWRYDDRADAVRQRAEQLRAIRRTCQHASN